MGIQKTQAGPSGRKFATARRGSGATAIYRNPSEGPLRVLSAVTAVFALGSALLAGMMLDHSVHISHHISFNERIFWAGGLITVFVGLFAAVWMYSRRMATAIDLSADGSRLSVETFGLLGREVREVERSEVTAATVHDGDARGEAAVSPPFIWVKVRNDRSFVVPLAAGMPERARLMRSLQPPRPS